VRVLFDEEVDKGLADYRSGPYYWCGHSMKESED
jgi:hypothetical protein